MSIDTLNELTASANAVVGSIRDKEQCFCASAIAAITRHHGADGLRTVWHRTECGSVGNLRGTALEKWYNTLNEFRTAFWKQVEAGAIFGHLPGSSLPV